MIDRADAPLPLGAGAHGEAVRDVQRRLAALGHDLGDDPGGEFGPATAAATRAFQRQRGLPADGICGPAGAAGSACGSSCGSASTVWSRPPSPS